VRRFVLRNMRGREQPVARVAPAASSGTAQGRVAERVCSGGDGLLKRSLPHCEGRLHLNFCGWCLGIRWRVRVTVGIGNLWDRCRLLTRAARSVVLVQRCKHMLEVAASQSPPALF